MNINVPCNGCSCPWVWDIFPLEDDCEAEGTGDTTYLGHNGLLVYSRSKRLQWGDPCRRALIWLFLNQTSTLVRLCGNGEERRRYPSLLNLSLHNLWCAAKSLVSLGVGPEMDPYSFSSPHLTASLRRNWTTCGRRLLLNENQWYGYKDVRNMHIGFILYDFFYFKEITIKPFTPSD